MANRKIKHITATLTGASSSETFDVCDEEAVHDYPGYYKGRSILILGDSISDENYSASSPNWVVSFRNLVTADGGSVTNYSNAGRSLSDVRTDNIISHLSDIPSGDYTDIIVFLGVNDWASSASRGAVSTALDSLASWIITNHPSARVFLFTPLKCVNTFNTAIPLDWYRGILVKEGSETYGWYTVDVFSEAPNYNGNIGGLQSNWTLDGLHLKPAYASIFANYVYNRLTNYVSSDIKSFTTEVVVSSYFNSKDLHIYYRSTGDITLYIDIGSYSPSSAITAIPTTLPEWSRPLLDVTSVNYSAYSGAFHPIRWYMPSGGKGYLIFDGTGQAHATGKIMLNYVSSSVIRPDIF